MKQAKLAVLALSTLLVITFIISQKGFALGGVTNTTYDYTTFTPSNGSIETTAGNIYNYTLTSEDKSYRWVGLWGNLTGSIKLKSGAGDFKTWTISSATAGSVIYATTNIAGIDPSDFEATNNADLLAADTAYGYAAALSDNIESTFTSTASFQSPSMQTAITVNTTQTDASIWTNYFIQRSSTAISGEEHVVWAVVVNPNQVGFNGQGMDYELLLPENEENGDGEGTATKYYLWVEFD